MKYLLCTILLAASLIATSRSNAVIHADSPQIAPITTTLAEGLPPPPQVTPIFAQATVLPAATLPYCGNYEGNTCAVNGHRIRCMWAPYEPGICFCSQNIWVCG